jgi:MFS transporter, DHA2 family, multidrug resistance protein
LIRRGLPIGRRARRTRRRIAFVRPLVEKASLALSVNEAWAMLACVAIAGLLLVPFARDREAG